MTNLPPPQTPFPASLPNTPNNPNPQYSINKTPNVHTIKIGSWEIETIKKPILNGKEIDVAEKSLNLPLPEMTFGNNSLRLSYSPSSSSSTTTTTSTSLNAPSGQDQVQLKFDSIEALGGVATGEGWEERVGGGVKVSMAEKWSSKSSSNSFSGDSPIPSKPVKPHDWTFSTCYSGSVSGPSSFRPSPTHSLPLSLLARQDPILDRILFYDDVPLFEDELHDNGESILNVRIRVMPHSFFILSRLFLRVDNVLFRIHDVRLYHAFGSGEIVKEVSGMEVSYEQVKRHLEKPSDLSPLTDPNWVYQKMLSLPSGPSQGGRPWPGLGKRVEVLRLPKSDLEGIKDGLEGVKI
ncbi:hypothetical protein I302_100212 [Kwoniella bestiolae CBS 10118]|uniref:Type 2A phosphatase activator TIP41 n=1 Tax=Kwoniella bestiolae CBS 10118 TaxID=1296100 RepID=A0A1B9G4E7_9TREE|nr:hypothetical protein I302_03585 [Kwoniella bestiolae CBS 10118]OCF25909.1 hypothetical protein I302_03585 [Kwoniella bestiolae CBS 10118]